jgi:hypothetical protein
MAVSTRIQGLAKTLTVELSESLSPQARSKIIADVAREKLAEAQQINKQAIGRIPEHTTTVDGRQGASFDAVQPDGTIYIEFDLLDDLFGWIDLQLIKHAPVLTGQFRRSFVLFADGVEVDPQAPSLPQASEYVYLNLQPYARKIEGDAKRKPLSKQAPDGVFQVVAELAARRFGNFASIKFSYRAPMAASGGTAKERRAADRKNRTPAIIVTPR